MRGQFRRHAALCILAIGDQYQHTRAFRALPQFFHTDPDGIANCRAVAGHARNDTVHQTVQCLQVQRHWRQHKGLAAEYDNADAVTVTRLDESAQYALDDCHARDLPAIDREVQRLHGTRGIDGQHQVITLGADFGVGLQQLRLHHCQYQRHP